MVFSNERSTSASSGGLVLHNDKGEACFNNWARGQMPVSDKIIYCSCIVVDIDSKTKEVICELNSLD